MEKEEKTQISFESEGNIHEEIAQMISKVNEAMQNNNTSASYLRSMNDMFRFFDDLYKNNISLLEKCHEYSAMVVLNASKIKAILSVTNQDKDVLQKLKSEHEEATKLIQTFYNSEMKAKKLINKLRKDMDVLNTQVQKGEAFSFGEEGSVFEASQDVSNLRIERDKANLEIASMKKQINVLNDKTYKLKEEINISKQEEEKLIGLIENVTEHENGLKAQNEGISSDILILKPVIKEQKSEYDNNIEKKNSKTNMITRFKEGLYTTYTTLSVVKDEGKGIKERVQRRSKHFMELKNKINTRITDLDTYQKQLNSFNDTVTVLKRELGEILNQTSLSSSYLEEINKESVLLSQEKLEYRRLVRESRNQIIEKAFLLSKNENERHQTQRLIAAMDLGLGFEYKQKVNESFHTNEIKNQIKNIKSDTIIEKGDLQDSKEVVLQLMEEIDSLRANTFQVEAKCQMTREYNNTTEEQLKQHSKDLSSYKEKKEHQIELCEKLRKERDEYQKKLSKVQKEMQYHQDKILEQELFESQTKEKMAALAEKAIEFHISSRVTKAECEQMEQNSSQIQKCVLATNRIISRLQAEVQLLHHILNEAEHDGIQIQKELSMTQKNSSQIQDKIHDQKVKYDEIISSIQSQEAYLKNCSISFNQKMSEIMLMQNDLRRLRSKTEALLEKKERLRIYQYECHRVQTELMFEKTRIATLTHEFSIKRNVHRWEVMEAVDPLYVKNLKYRSSLFSKLDKSHQEFLRLSKEKDDLIVAINENQIKLQNMLTKDSVYNGIFRYQEDLNQKIKQIEDIQNLINTNQGKMSSSLNTIEDVRLRLSTKRGTAAVLRTKTSLASRNFDNTMNDWFITEQRPTFTSMGGGFIPKTHESINDNGIDPDLSIVPSEPHSFRTKRSPLLSPSIKRILKPAQTPHSRLNTRTIYQ